LGGLYGAMLARGGHDVHFLLHRDYGHVSTHGLQIESTWGNFHLSSVLAHPSADTIPPVDVTIVALKTTQNHLLVDLLPPPTREGGVVLVLQNGLDVEQQSVDVVGIDRVLGGCCFLCSNKVGPGHIRHIDFGKIVFGKYGKATGPMIEKGQQICRELNEAGVDTQFADDLAVVRWRKLMWNIPFNGLSVVLNASTKSLMDNRDACALSDAIIREVHAAAAACGVEVPEEAIDITLENTRRMKPYDSSMRLDYLNQRPMEVEAILGNPLKVARAFGHAMPRVEMLYQQLQYLDACNADVYTIS